MIKLGRLEIKNPYILAPMAMYSDIGLRRICSEYGCAYAFTEQIYTEEFNSRSETVKRKLDMFDKIGLQFITNNATDLKEAIRIVKEKEFYNNLDNVTSIDINIGCPTQQVMARNLGARLLNQPKLVRELFSTLRKESPLPVSAKIRLAINAKHKKTAPYLRIANIAKEEELDFLIVHARNAGQMYSGEADIEALKEISENVDIPLVGNGGVCDAASADRMLQYCDSVMIGQHALREPYIFKQLNDRTWKCDPEAEKINCIKKYLEYTSQYNIGFQHVKIHIQSLLKGIEGQERTVKRLTHLSTLEEVKELMEKYVF